LIFLINQQVHSWFNASDKSKQGGLKIKFGNFTAILFLNQNNAYICAVKSPNTLQYMKKKENDYFKELYSYLDDSPPSLKELFEKRVEELGLSSRQVESGLNIERKSLNAILEQEAQRIDAVNLLKIGSFLDMGFDETLKIFIANLPVDLIKELEKARRFKFIVSNFDIKALKSAKFFESVADFDDIENRIKLFFGIDDIYDYERQVGAAFSRTKRNYNNKMLDFWVKSTYAYLEKVNNPNDYDRAGLKELIPKLKPSTRDTKNGLRNVCRALFNLGITVVFQSYFPTTQVRGATFFVNDKPCIVLTNFNKNYATLWFALLHELYHVLFDLEDIKTNTYHLTGESDLLLSEDSADNFARQYLLSDDKTKYIYPFIHDKLIIERYADKLQIHPAIIYNFYCYDKDKEGKTYWGAFQKYMPDVSDVTKNLNIILWQKESIAESVNEFKELITS